ncbi:hypothetical protein SF23_19965 [Streptomyces sp. MBRL 10]|nr:hypothetical protein SF23_19965 [Streptomyces sp. MBRL 10]
MREQVRAEPVQQRLWGGPGTPGRHPLGQRVEGACAVPGLQDAVRVQEQDVARLEGERLGGDLRGDQPGESQRGRRPGHVEAQHRAVRTQAQRRRVPAADQRTTCSSSGISRTAAVTKPSPRSPPPSRSARTAASR